jgi:hypothetical protein
MRLDLIELFQQSSRSPELHMEFDAQFWRVLDAAGLVRWRKGDPMAASPQRLLIGLASYSVPEVELAQRLIDRLETGPLPVCVELFNVLDVKDMSDFQNYVPGMGSVYQTPVVGLWSDGLLADAVQGSDARVLIQRIAFGESR